MKVCMMIGKQAGIIGLLTLLARGFDVVGVVTYDPNAWEISRQFGIRNYKSVNDNVFKKLLRSCDLLVSVHGREIVSRELLDMPRLGCINVHPCLSLYKPDYKTGVSPIKRLVMNKGVEASVGVHYMTEEVDGGKIIAEHFVNVCDCNSVESVYNRLYPVYVSVLLEAIDKIMEENERKNI